MIRTNVSGETMIFRNEKGFYSTTFSRKVNNPNGTTDWQNEYINVNFAPKPQQDIPTKTRINIKNGFWSFDRYTNKEGKEITTWKIVVTDYEIVGAQKTQPVAQNQEFIPQDDLPF